MANKKQPPAKYGSICIAFGDDNGDGKADIALDVEFVGHKVIDKTVNLSALLTMKAFAGVLKAVKAFIPGL